MDATQTELEAEIARLRDENDRLRAALAEVAEEDGAPEGRAFPDNRKRIRAISNIARKALDLRLLKN